MNTPKVELVQGETPTQQLVKKAAKECTITDERGRVITLRKPQVLKQFHLVEALGPTAANRTYVMMVLPLIFVVKVDDIDVLFPNSKAEVEALIQMLDEDGIAAVSEAVEKNFGVQDPKAEVESVKK